MDGGFFYVCVFLCENIFTSCIFFSWKVAGSTPIAPGKGIHESCFLGKTQIFNPSQTVLQGELSVGRGNGGKWLLKTISWVLRRNAGRNFMKLRVVFLLPGCHSNMMIFLWGEGGGSLWGFFKIPVLGGGFIFFMPKIGEDEPKIDVHILQMGWNHQADLHFLGQNRSKDQFWLSKFDPCEERWL